MTSVAVCLACFNRRDRTLACLESLYRQQLPDGVRLVVHLLDDASPDGTAEAVREKFPRVHVHVGDGQRYWAGGLRVAYGAALAEGHDYYLWLNDDVTLFADSIGRALDVHRELQADHGGQHLVVGAMRASAKETTTYSGFTRASNFVRWRFRHLEPFADRPRECLTMNGNFLLIPRAVAHLLGNIDRAFSHSLADLDFGLRARRRGVRNWILPGYAGICDANVGGRKDWKSAGLTLKQRLQIMEHPLGYPLRPSMAFARNFGLLAPVVVAAPYLSLVRASLPFRLNAEHVRS